MFGLYPVSNHNQIWHICSSVLHQLLPAVLRNSTAYQQSSNATFYRCIGRGCTQVLQLRKYNRLVVHMSVSRCGGQCGWVEGVQTGIVLSWQITHNLSNKRQMSVSPFAFHNKHLLERGNIYFTLPKCIEAGFFIDLVGKTASLLGKCRLLKARTQFSLTTGETRGSMSR